MENRTSSAQANTRFAMEEGRRSAPFGMTSRISKTGSGRKKTPPFKEGGYRFPHREAITRA